MVIGAYGHGEWDNNINTGNGSGSAYVFEEDESGNWKQTAKLTPDDWSGSAMLFGISVGIFGDTIAVGATRNPDDERSGYWNQRAKITPNDSNANQRFGVSLSVRARAAGWRIHRRGEWQCKTGSPEIVSLTCSTDLLIF